MHEPDDLDQWLAALAGGKAQGKEGQAGVGATLGPATRSNIPDATRLRKVIGEQERAISEQIEKTALPHDQATQQLLFRLRREGLLDKPGKSKWWLPLALAASVVLVTLVVVQIQRPEPPVELALYGEPPTYRGPLSHKAISAKDPRGAAEQLKAEIERAGITAKIFRDAAGYYVDFDFPEGISEVFGRDLVPGGWTPSPGMNRITIASP